MDVGLRVGLNGDGARVGITDGEIDADGTGTTAGEFDGHTDVATGSGVGAADGSGVCAADGSGVGAADGSGVGAADG